MDLVGQYKGSKVFYVKPGSSIDERLVNKCICLVIANDSFDVSLLWTEIDKVIPDQLIEVVSCGKLAEQVHLELYIFFIEELPELDIKLEVEIDNSLTDILWGCFHGNIYPDNVLQQDICVVVVSLDSEDYSSQMIEALEQLNTDEN